jgi:hypothetical protein
MLVTILVALRDAILAAALAWVGITLESSQTTEPCSGGTQVCERAN